ncbi:MAG: RagB/SusD family nutrient uptake outer membrane protein [Agriterribacter sp.]
MNKIKRLTCISLLLISLLTACHKVEVPITTEINPDIFPKDSAQFAAVTGPIYVALRGNFSLDYWFMQTLSTDEAILPARGGNWYDNQNYRMLHYHNWTKDHPWSNSCWQWLSKVIGVANQAHYLLSNNAPEGNYRTRTLAEIRTMRALAYFMMMDLYGNVPLYTEYGDFTPKDKSPRNEVFNFIESELKTVLPLLSTDVNVSTYGRPTRYLAQALLAKMYLNAAYYTGAARYNECIAACDDIIASNKYALEPRESYLKMFYPDNGPAMKEFIFAIPYDAAATSGSYLGLNGYMYRARYDVPRSMRNKFSLPFTPSAPESTLPEFYAYFNDANDVRNGQWLTGKQYQSDGTTPLTVTTTKKGYDQFYTGADGGDSYTYQVELTPNVVLRQNEALFDCGNDEIAWNMGYRNIKFYPDATSATRNQNNDVPVFRYSDIVLMKAEAILRGGSSTLGHTALSLVNSLRAERSTSAPWAAVTLEDIYKERSRELVMETWHRNDMIRFGKYEDEWGFKTNADTYRRVFPIPTIAMTLNTALTPNPGY